jgi:hypothetical protein
MSRKSEEKTRKRAIDRIAEAWDQRIRETMRVVSTAATKPGEARPLTVDMLINAIKLIDAHKLPPLVGITCRPETEKALRAELEAMEQKEIDRPMMIWGAEIFVKEGQRVAYLEWYDRELLNIYLREEVKP